jgi:hypothetical protein
LPAISQLPHINILQAINSEEIIMPVLPLLFFGLITALLAARKGYNPLYWFLAGGIVGLLLMAFRPFTNDEKLSEASRVALQREGNLIGLIISGLGVALGLILTIVLHT